MHRMVRLYYVLASTLHVMEWYTTCSCKFRPVQLKNRSSETYFFDIVTTHNDQPNYVKHILDNIYVFFSLFGDWVWGWDQPMEWYTTC